MLNVSCGKCPIEKSLLGALVRRSLFQINPLSLPKAENETKQMQIPAKSQMSSRICCKIDCLKSYKIWQNRNSDPHSAPSPNRIG